MTSSPLPLPFPIDTYVSVPDLVAEQARARPDRIALVHGPDQMDYGRLDRQMDTVAAALRRDGVALGDVIAICAASSVAYAAVFLGALRAGVAVAPLSPSSTPEAIAGMALDAGAKLLFLDEANAQALGSVSSSLRAMPSIMLDAGTAGQSLHQWLEPSAPFDRPAIDASLPFNIIYSSGTTGTPKGIVQSHGMRWFHVKRGLQNGYGPEAVTLLSTPLYSNTTLGSFFPSISLGATVVLMDRFDATRYLELAQSHRVTHTMLVPVQYQRLLDHPGFDKYDLSSFRKKFCTSAPFNAKLKAEVVRRWPGGLIDIYGMTEGGGTCMLLAHEHPDKLHTVGRPTLGSDVRLIDEAGHEVEPGQMGEVVGRSPSMMIGYHRQAQKTAEAEWHDPEGNRYIRTGDVGRFDTDGFLVLMDRKKDMIISGGFNIYPSDLEDVLSKHPDIADCAVVGVESAQWGETPVAFAVARNGAALDAAQALAWANERLGKMQRLREVRVVDSLPRSAIGKVLKRELRDTLRETCV